MTVSLPKELYEQLLEERKRRKINVSKLLQKAVKRELDMGEYQITTA